MNTIRRLFVCAVLAFAGCLQSEAALPKDVLPGWTDGLQTLDGASFKLSQEGLEITATADGKRAGVRAPTPGAAWDLSTYGAVVVRATNTGKGPVVFYAGAANPGASGLMDNTRNGIILMPGRTGELKLRLVRRPEDPGYEPFRHYYMYFKNINVRDNTIDPSSISEVAFWMDYPKAGQSVRVEDVKLVGEGERTKPFLPFVDQFGQYIHSDWPGKIHSEAEFAARIEDERQERADWPGPASWNRYGGWEKGPSLRATGFFRVEKFRGKWWFVDPNGKLFWSHGPTGVGFGGDYTPISGRENWFADLPSKDGVFGKFHNKGRGATYMHYEKRDWEGFDFSSANILRKYGEAGLDGAAKQLHERMRSWGFNTLGNWSSPEVYGLRRTPYTVAIHVGGPSIHYRMRDIYHPDWRKSLRERLERERGTTAGDPWNLGYFVDNEQWWGWRPRAAAVGLTALEAAPDSPTKLEFVSDLRKRHGTIEALNLSWKTEYKSWDDLIASRKAPNAEPPDVLRDCGDFGMRFAEYYFSTVKEELKRVAPNNLYLGVRFHGHIDAEVVRLCAKYADVVSYNVYDVPPTGRLNQYLPLDVPILCGEWGIASNPLQTPFRGDKPISPDPHGRVDVYERYMDAALRHPLLVGAHFFQFRDQPVSGRPDGEGVLRGLVNITDTPHFDLIQANRRIAYELYERRSASE